MSGNEQIVTWYAGKSVSEISSEVNDYLHKHNWARVQSISLVDRPDRVYEVGAVVVYEVQE